jgi:uncharacterized membrane protein
MSERITRSIAKGISWRIVGSIDTFVISWLITGHVKAAGGIALVEVVTKVALFSAHERVWLRVPWGKKTPAVSEN